MFCPKCGSQLPDDSRFCSDCGERLDNYGVTPPVEVSTPPAEISTPPVEVDMCPAEQTAQKARATLEYDSSVVKPRKKINTRKIAIIALAAVIAIGAVFGIGALLSSGGGDNAYVYFSNGKYELLTDLNKADPIQIASSKSEYPMSNMVSFSPDGKYVYYYTKVDYYSNTGTLCRAEYAKLKKNSNKNDKYIEIIASNVRLGFQFLKNGSILYRNGDNTLYFYDGNEVTQLAKNVDHYRFDDSNRVIYAIGDDYEGYTLYGLSLDDPNNHKKIASNYSYLVNYDDFNNILYVTMEDDYSKTLYSAGFDKNSEKLGTNVVIMDSADGTTYFTAHNGNMLSLYDYVEDTHAAADLGIAEPQLSDFGVPEYSYEQIYELPEDDTYELYTSCTRRLYWFTEYWHYSMEEALERDWGDHTAAIHTALQSFIDKYASTANEYGFIPVTDEVKAALQKINNANPDERNEEDWIWLCFGRYQSDIVYDYEAYYEAYDKWSEAESRVMMREQLKDPENGYPVKTLYCYKDGVLTTINDTVLTVETFCNGYMYNTVDMITDKVNMEDLYYYDEVFYLFTIDSEAENHIINTVNGKTSRMSSRAAETFAEYDYDYAELYFVDNAVYMTDSNDALYIATISNGVVNDFEIVTDDASVLTINGSVLYYASGSYSNGDVSYCDLYSCKNGESTLLARDVLYSNAYLFDDGMILAYTGYRSYSGYELSSFNAKGEVTLIADNVSHYIRCDKSTLLYISDGDLYCYNGKERTLVQTGAEYFWSQDVMGARYLINYYDGYNY